MEGPQKSWGGGGRGVTTHRILRNGPDKDESDKGNEHVGMQKGAIVLISDWLKQEKLRKLHKAVCTFILTFQTFSRQQNLVSV